YSSAGCAAWPLRRIQEQVPLSPPFAACPRYHAPLPQASQEWAWLARPLVSQQRKKGQLSGPGPPEFGVALASRLLPPRCCARRGLEFLRRLHREICRARNGLIRMDVGGVHFQCVLARRERRERQKTLDGDLLPGLLHVFRGFLELHAGNRFVALLHCKLEIRAGLVRGLVRLQVINLQVDAQPVRSSEIALKSRPDFGGAQHKLAGADLLGGNVLN